jgi:hypothetical protein
MPDANLRTDRDLLPVAIFLWLGSFARVAVAISRHEVFGVEPTLALVCLVLIPGLVLAAHGHSKGRGR